MIIAKKVLVQGICLHSNNSNISSFSQKTVLAEELPCRRNVF